MSAFGNVIRSIVGTLRRQAAKVAGQGSPADRRGGGVGHVGAPGGPGGFETVQVDPAAIGAVRMTYVPSTDGDPDPGEIVWTWVPYEERDGRGKDRPVLIIAEESAGTRLAVQLTSQPHTDSPGYVAIGSGPWDPQRRPSWVNVERIFRVHPGGMRREASAVDKSSYVRVAAALRDLYGWR